MAALNICFSLSADSVGLERQDILEQNYQLVYKKLASFLYSHPHFSFSISFLGDQLVWYKKNHPEFIDLVSQLTSRKQLEILGGGYYDPIFPLLFPMDRSGQIELLTSVMRQGIGKRPRGMSIHNSIWEPPLIPCLKTCGMEYVFLDSSLIPPDKQFYLPLIMAYQGKSVGILPLFRSLKPIDSSAVATDVRSYVDKVFRSVNDETRGDKYSSLDVKRVVCVPLEISDVASLLSSGWFEEADYFSSQPEFKYIDFSCPLNALRTAGIFVKAYVPSGMREDVAQWAQVPYMSVQNKSHFPLTVYDFLQNYNLSDRLYHRMMYVSLLINQSHGDKVRKKEARELLWAGQKGCAYICSPDGVLASSYMRQSIYKNLCMAEKLARECGEFHESITSFDYDGDGNLEYICQMQHYTTCIQKLGGSIFELDIMHNTGNYADNMSRISRFDGVSDSYQRGIFVEHLFENADFEAYLHNKPSGNGIFSQVMFTEAGFDGQRHDIRLIGKGLYSEMQQTVSLRKNYSLTSAGIMVQYILKNESPLVIKAKFVVELNFADIINELSCYTTEVITSNKKYSANELKNGTL
ncbi:MAG: DUF1926 domain-containing protein, partial [Treponema sp.]|nr:DUF1926 domain-containing protein [Treponema sp.]